MRDGPLALVLTLGVLAVVAAFGLYVGFSREALLFSIAGTAALFAFVYATCVHLGKAATTGVRPWWLYPAGFIVMVIGFPLTMDMWDDFFGPRPEERTKATETGSR